MEPLNWGKKITNLKIINVPLFDFWTQILIHSPKFTLSSHVSLLSMFRSYWYLFIFPFSFGGSSTTKDSMNAVPISLGNIDEVKTTFTKWLLCTKNDSKTLHVLPYLNLCNNSLLSRDMTFFREQWGLAYDHTASWRGARITAGASVLNLCRRCTIQTDEEDIERGKYKCMRKHFKK